MVMSIAQVAQLYRQNAGQTLQTVVQAQTPQTGQPFADALEAASKITTAMADQSSVSQPIERFTRSVDDLVTRGRDDLIRAEKISVDSTIGTASITDLVSAVSSAETSLQTIVAIRDRVITAYQEIMRMPI